MRYIDNYTNKMLQLSREEKLYIQFIGEREYLYSGWEINQITSHLNNLYYKNEILNTVKSYLREGTRPKNIIIMNDSIKLNNSYSKYNGGYLNLNNEEHLQNFYHLGSPVEYMYNEKIKKMFVLFELTRSLYSNNTESKLKFKKQKVFLKILIEQRDDIPNGKILSNIISDMLRDANSHGLQEDVDISIQIERKVKSLKKFFESWDQIPENKNELNRGIDSKDFKYCFKRLGKPIVCIYDEETHSVKLLCIDMIAMQYFKEDNSRFLETKEIKQNSPLVITVGIAITFLPSLLKLGESVLKFTKTKKEYAKEELSLEQETKMLMKDISDTEELIKRNEEIISSHTEILNQEIFQADSQPDKEIDATIEKIDAMNTEMTLKFKDILQSKDIKVKGV